MSESLALMNNAFKLFLIFEEMNMMNLAHLRVATIYIRFESIIEQNGM